jgi:hypothetical protein
MTMINVVTAITVIILISISTKFDNVSAWTTSTIRKHNFLIKHQQARHYTTLFGSDDDMNSESVLPEQKRNQQQQSDKSSNNNNFVPIVTSRQPQKLERGTFLGFRKIVRPSKGSTSFSTTSLTSTTAGAALMPDGGLSPCVIRVLGVGGAGCNAVCILQFF